MRDGHRKTFEDTRMPGANMHAPRLQLQTHGYLQNLEAALAAFTHVAASQRNIAPPSITRRCAPSATHLHVQDLPAPQRATGPSIGQHRNRYSDGQCDRGIARFHQARLRGPVRERVAEMLPEPHLPALATLVH